MNLQNDDMNLQRKDSVLVTGGAGFIGRAVGKLLQRSGYRVLSLDLPGAAAAAQGRDGLREIECDISDEDQLQKVFEGERIGGIIHLAAILPTAAQREPSRAMQINVMGSLYLLELAREFGVARTVFGSSLSIYGTWPDELVVSELDRAAPEDLYGAAKLCVEQLGETCLGPGSVFVSLRIGRVVGAGAQSSTSAWRSQIFELIGATQAAQIALPYAGWERILLVHVDDVARALITLLGAPRLDHRVYNAPCESVVVADLKHELEGLNAKLRVKLGEGEALGNPRLLDCSRFQQDFSFGMLPIFEQLRNEVERQRT